MKNIMTIELAKDLAELAKKHSITLMTGNGEQLIKTTKGLEGYHVFLTKGEKVLALRGGEHGIFPSSTIIKLGKQNDNNN